MSKRLYYSDPIIAAMMHKHHGVKYSNMKSGSKPKLPSKEIQKMSKQVLHNSELVRGDNEDYFDWVFRARSFHDSAKLLGYFSEADVFPNFLEIGKTYMLKDRGPVSIYPSFFYVASHSIELLLKGVAIFSGSTFKDLSNHNHDIEKLIVTTKQNGFSLPKFTKGELIILRNMNLVIKHGVVKYPNSKRGGNDIYKMIRDSISIDGKERYVNKKSDSPSDQNSAIQSMVFQILSTHGEQYKVREKLAILENSLDNNNYSSIWNKISNALEKAVVKNLYKTGAIAKV